MWPTKRLFSLRFGRVNATLVVAALWQSISFASPTSPGADQVSVSTLVDLPTPGAAVAIAWSPDGSALVAASDYGSTLTIWDRSGKQLQQIKRHGGGPTLWGSIAFVNRSAQIIFPPPDDVDNQVALSVWGAESGTILRTVNGPEPQGDYPLNRGRFFMTSPDQVLLALATGGNRATPSLRANVIVYDTQTWATITSAKVLPGVSSLCVFANGRRIAVGKGISGAIAVLDPKTGANVSEVQAYENSPFGTISVDAIAGSPDGDLIFAGLGLIGSNGNVAAKQQSDWEQSLNSARMLRVQDGRVFASLDSPQAPIRQAKWDPKGRFVAFVDNAKGLFLWSPWTKDGAPKRVDLPSRSLALDFSLDGKLLAVATDRGVRIFSIK